MGLSDQILVVVSVLEGRRFPRRTRHKILVETKFDGETLSTDPIDHVENPDFTTELAWELNKKSLHQHRLQRTPVKVQCYAVDVLTSVREPVGYVTLDLRSAQQQPVRPQWYTLLSSKYQRQKPEIKLLLSLEDDSVGKGEKSKVDPQRRASSTPLHHAKADSRSPAKSLRDLNLQPVLNEEEGYYEIGPQHSQTQTFVLSVTIGLASNLAKLIPSKFELQDPKLGGGFYFYYSLLGNDVTNEVFQDLLQPSFPAERASVRISCTGDVLKTYISQRPALEIHLCSADQSLGMATVSLQSLLSKELRTLDSSAVVEGLFSLVPSSQLQEQTPGEDGPVVGVSVALKVEQEQAPTVAGGISPKLASGGRKKDTSIGGKHSPLSGALPLKHPKEKELGPEFVANEDAGKSGERGIQSAPTAGSTPNFVSPQSNQKNKNNETPTMTQSSPAKKQSQDSPVRMQPKGFPARKQPQGSPVQKPKQQNLEKPHNLGPSPSVSPSVSDRPHIMPGSRHFCFSIDLRSIRNLEVTTTVNIFLRYTYPFFGSSAPVITSPPVAVQRHTEVLVPRSFCAFDFASIPQLLQETFTRVPLVVEVWHRDHMAGNILLGVGRISLAGILASERTRLNPKTSGKSLLLQTKVDCCRSEIFMYRSAQDISESLA